MMRNHLLPSGRGRTPARHAREESIPAINVKKPVHQAARFALRHGRFCSYRVENQHVDVTRGRFSSSEGNGPEPKPCFASPQERPLYLISDFIDFTPLILLRRELRTRFGGGADPIENIALHCLFLWCLACQPDCDA